MYTNLRVGFLTVKVADETGGLSVWWQDLQSHERAAIVRGAFDQLDVQERIKRAYAQLLQEDPAGNMLRLGGDIEADDDDDDDDRIDIEFDNDPRPDALDLEDRADFADEFFDDDFA